MALLSVTSTKLGKNETSWSLQTNPASGGPQLIYPNEKTGLTDIRGERSTVGERRELPLELLAFSLCFKLPLPILNEKHLYSGRVKDT